jgi:hypothetical protein
LVTVTFASSKFTTMKVLKRLLSALTSSEESL